LHALFESALDAHMSKLYIGNTCTVNVETFNTKYSDIVLSTQFYNLTSCKIV